MCNTCVGYDEGNVTREVFNQHQKRKNEGFKLKDLDKAAADGRTTFVITADTVALLLAPYNRANVMFFHSKLNIHNFTFYDLKTKVVLNYVWPEVSGDVEAPNFTTCYNDYLTNVLENNPSCSQINIWSDGCTYQNRCNILASAILTFAVENNVTIYHKYLEVGHTHMECDSIYSTVEGAIKRSEGINLPSDYIHIIHGARKSHPYRVKYLDYTFFRDYRKVCGIKSIKPSTNVGPPYVVNIRQLKYKIDGSINFNLTYEDDKWENLPYNKINLTFSEPPPLYTASCKISYIKWQHLQDIKQTINKEYHCYYDNLDHLDI